MLLNKKIAFIGGGNMAEAIISGLIEKKVVDPCRIFVSEKRPERCEYLQKFGIYCESDDCFGFLKDADIVILAVKPQNFDDAAKTLTDLQPGTLFISILAGVRIAKIEQAVGTSIRVVRVMPNTPALVGEGMAGISAGTSATQDDIIITKYIFDQLGKSVVVEERMLDLLTGVSGSGPAYVFYCIEAMCDAAVTLGMSESQAELLVVQTFKGAVELILKSGDKPSVLRQKVTSKGGTTEQGIAVLDKHNLKKIFFDAIDAATKKSIELSNNG
ncbi:MAG: pyrroline-5-carboxylate reductase [Candidatus Auribacterota bacterium]|jgi:pyrroline-5-carboxylate reductase|nr:pyrroline-5-carboxylate reductase [Candidatus Auribacterota bacterium]